MDGGKGEKERRKQESEKKRKEARKEGGKEARKQGRRKKAKKQRAEEGRNEPKETSNPKVPGVYGCIRTCALITLRARWDVDKL